MGRPGMGVGGALEAGVGAEAEAEAGAEANGDDDDMGAGASASRYEPTTFVPSAAPPGDEDVQKGVVLTFSV